MTEIFDKPVENPPTGVYSIIKEFAIAEVNFTWMSEVKELFPEEWDILHKNHNSAADAAIHLWMKQYMPEMYNWLMTQNIDWIGFTDSTWIDNEIHEFLYIRMHKEKDVTAFKLTWC